MQVSRKTGLAALTALVVMAGTNAFAQEPVGTGTLSRASGWYPAGSPLEVIATPDATSSTFKDWTGNVEPGEIDGNTVTFTVNGPRSLTATFLINLYNVEFIPGALGTRTGGGELQQSIKHGLGATAPTVEAIPGYMFDDWDVAFDNVTAALTVNALYTTNSYTLTFDSAGGSAVANITQPFGTEITPPANPTKTGHTFAGWIPEIPATMPLDGGNHVAQWTANAVSVIIISAHGTPQVGGETVVSGAETGFNFGDTVNFSIAGSPEIIENDSKFDATSWVGTGSAPATGTEMSGSFEIFENSTITWQWSTNYWIELNTAGE
jgi:hypothetical protein